MPSEVCVSTNIQGLSLTGRGKVRDIYRVQDYLVLVATDRISAFDCVLPDPIPWKGRVLTQISRFWFESFPRDLRTHYVSTRLEDLPVSLGEEAMQVMEGRTTICRLAEPIPMECVVRGYLAGSAWKEYCKSGTVCGQSLPSGLQEYGKLEQPLFTPATKAASGHDENISFERMKREIGEDLAERLKSLSLRIFSFAAEYAQSRGLLLADTKFEFGHIGLQVVLIDEVLTPDSSRYWSIDEYRPGQVPPSFDKQFIRDYLLSLPWNQQPPAPALGTDIIAATTARYLEAYRILTGSRLEEEMA
jgi:phosphoribosylaminoimidazole-succinocarboxamide synthase